MSRALITLRSKADTERALRWIAQAPPGTRLEFKRPARSLPQNDRMWWMLTAIASQVDWYGHKLTPDDWKDLFSAALRKARIVPAIDGKGFVALGLRTSEMSKDEMANLLELIAAFAAERGVVFGDEEKAA